LPIHPVSIRIRALRSSAAAALAIVSAALLAWGYCPLPRRTLSLHPEGQSVTEAPLAETTALTEKASADPGVLASASSDVVLEFPAFIRIGDRDLVHLRVGAASPDPQAIDVGDGPASAEARLELPGALVRPPEAISQPLKPGRPLVFSWSVSLAEPTEYRGTAWLFLTVFGEGSDSPNRIPLSAQTIDIKGIGLLGLSGEVGRISGLLCGIGALLLALPFAEDILRRLSARPRRRR